MIDLHTHSLLSDGVLLPSELARRAEVKGYKIIGITDHVDMSNIDFVLPRIVKACKSISKHWKIKTVPGVEITHAPIQEIPPLVKYARTHGAKIVIGHGETISEPVMPGTNRAFIKAKVDILAHPGNISAEDAKLAKRNNVFLEITTRKSHAKTNNHVLKIARKYGNNLSIDNDAHAPDDLLDAGKRKSFIKRLGLTYTDVKATELAIVKKIKL